jgi:D-glycero-D-manno-heptose 1,7-bisphosphate phosphatase
MKKAVFLDRDGVINRVLLKDGIPCSPRTIKELVLNDGIANFLAQTRKAGFLNIVFTNQPDITRGLMDPENLQVIHDFLRKNLAIDDIYLCPHDDADNCFCRKPKPGMLIEAAQKWDINLDISFIIGDQWKDVKAGKNAGCITILLDFPYNKKVECDFRSTDLRSALEFITCS